MLPLTHQTMPALMEAPHGMMVVLLDHPVVNVGARDPFGVRGADCDCESDDGVNDFAHCSSFLVSRGWDGEGG